MVMKIMYRHYALTDLHGMGKLWDQIKDYCDETDVIYFLGDATDRGLEGLRILHELLLDKRVIFIKGNHEDIMEKAIPHIMKYHFGNEVSFWLQNGGQPTMEAFNELSEKSQYWFYHQLNQLPNYLIYKNTEGQEILLSHAGTDPIDPWDLDKMPNRYDESPWQWDRNHFYSIWDTDPKWQNTWIIHGHTPVPYVIKRVNNADSWFDRKPTFKEPWDENILVYADGHKIDLDLASFSTGRIALFDLDRMRVEKYFETEVENIDRTR